jgi:hypothetical protein
MNRVYFNEILNLNNRLQQNIEIVNVNGSKYNINLNDLNKDFIVNNYYDFPYVKQIFNINLGKIYSFYKNMGLNIIKTQRGCYFFRKEQVDEYSKLMEELITVNEAKYILIKEFKTKISNKYFDNKFKVIRDIPFFQRGTFIKKDEFDDFITKKRKMNNMNLLSIAELNEMITDKFYGHKLYTKDSCNICIKNICYKLNLEYYERFDESNCINIFSITNNAKDRIINYLFDNLVVVIKGDPIYYLEKEYITKEILENSYYELSELRNKFNFETMHRFEAKLSMEHLTRLRINIIRLMSPICETYYRKEEVDHWIGISKMYTKSNIVKSRMENSLGVTINKAFSPHFFKARQINIINNPPLLGKGVFVLNDDIPKLMALIKYEEDLNLAETSYQRFQIKKKTLKVFNDKIPRTLKMYDEYCLITSNNSKSDDIRNLSSRFLNIYQILCSRLKVELENLSKAELNEVTNQLIKAASKSSSKMEKAMILFLRYLKKNTSIRNVPTYVTHKSKGESYKPYNIENYIQVLFLISNTLTEHNKIKQLIGKRTISSSFLYVYLHFVLAWRKKDLLKGLPFPNLALVNLDANSFLNWIQDEDNIFTEEMGRLICRNIEEQISRKKIKSGKTDTELVCIIPEFMYTTLGLLFCLCEANRVYEESKHKRSCKTSTLISVAGTEGPNIEKSIKVVCGISINEMLGDNFNNIRGIKSFLTNISEKSEEFKLGAGYYYAQILRAHKDKTNLVSEVTKIYVEKDIGKASVNAFLTGTMSCVKYNILSLIDSKFESYSYKMAESEVMSLKMTPYEVEMTMKIVGEKSTKINNFLKERLTSQIEKELFLTELLYGKKSYAKHINTKCLFRVVNVAKSNIRKIGITENKECVYNTNNCIGCEYFIALKYFIYEFGKRFDDVLDDLESSNTLIDIKMNLDRINTLYVPMIKEMQIEIGKHRTEELLNSARFKELIIAKKLQTQI